MDETAVIESVFIMNVFVEFSLAVIGTVASLPTLCETPM